jgi:hypothetical protein
MRKSRYASSILLSAYSGIKRGPQRIWGLFIVDALGQPEDCGDKIHAVHELTRCKRNLQIDKRNTRPSLRTNSDVEASGLLQTSGAPKAPKAQKYPCCKHFLEDLYGK